MTSTPHNPDDRDLLDFADAVAAGENPQPHTDLERTFLHVQHAMQGESGAIPSDLKQSTWEDVMSTLALAPERPISNRTRRQNGLEAPRISRPKRLQWTPMASIAAAVLVILASVGIWRINTMPNDSLPPLAPHVAGITSGDDVALGAATPDATAVVDESGNISIPIVQHVDEQPFDGPVIWLTTTGDVMYDDGSGEVQTIATGAFQVTPQTTNVIQVLTKAPEKDMENKDGQQLEGYTATYHHLFTGKTLVDDGTFSSYLGGPNTHGSLMVLTIADAPGQWSIVNCETMESRSISELTGGQYRSSDSITVAVSDDFSTIAIGTSQYESEASALLTLQSGMPGEIAVFPADLSEPSWVTVPEGMPAVANISLSPDGSKIAFIASDRSEFGSTMTVAVVDVATNEELTRTEQLDTGIFGNFQWATGGDAFVIISESSVQRFATDGSEPTILLDSEGSIRQLPRMIGSNLIYLEVSSVSRVISTPEPATTELVILDATTGETMSVQGDPWDKGMSFPVTISVDLSPIPVSQDGLTAELVHPLTGEVYSDVVANVDDPMMRPDFEPVEGQGYNQLQTVTASPNVSIVELADGNLAIVTTNEDSFDFRTIERPEAAVGLQLQISPGGEYLIAGTGWQIQDEGDSYFLLDLTDPNAEWIQGNPGENIWFAEIRED